MESREVTRTVLINASPTCIWDVLTHAEHVSRWMLGADVSSLWTVGADIDFVVKLPGHDHIFHDRGTVLAAEPGLHLRYNHWSEATGIVDTPETRSIFDWRIESHAPTTLLSVKHMNLSSYEALKHAEFFFGYALNDIKTIAESLQR